MREHVFKKRRRDTEKERQIDTNTQADAEPQGHEHTERTEDTVWRESVRTMYENVG